MEQSLTIYKASAGSGKTFTLAVEYIAELLWPHAEKAFEHILAVTFTNKATAEMKGRILETLYGLKMQLADAQDYMDAIQKRFQDSGNAITPEQVSRQAGRALEAILHNYSHFRVETIDSFFQSILRNMARELGLAANLQVELSHEEIIDSAVDSIIETMDTKPEVKQWVLGYIHEQLDSGDKWDIVTPLKAFAGNIFKEEYQRRSKEELSRISDAAVVKSFKEKMQAIREQALQEVQDAVDGVTSLIEDFSQIKYERNIRSFLAKARDMSAEGPGSTIESISFKSAPANAQELQAAYAHLVGIYPARRKDYASARLALRHLGPLRLLEHIDERARELEAAGGRFTLSSTPALLSKMVEGSDAPFIFEKIGTYINNVMIDEFQDTSRMQWENFKKLLFEKLASGGKGLLVGDIKQSIYRWRGGDWKILYGIEREPELARFNIKPEPLDTNFRSHQVIVDFNNNLFPKAAAQLDAVWPDAPIKLRDIYSDVEQQKKKADGKGFVRVKLFKEADDYQQATIQDMVEQIRALQAKGLDASEIAILVRTNEMARKIVEGFGEAAPDIHLVSDEAFQLDASLSVQMMVAAMRMLLDTRHDDLISEKFLMLHYRRDVLRKQDTTVQSIAMADAADVLPEAFWQHRDELRQLPLYILAEKLWRTLSLDGIQGEDIYVLAFLDELQNYLRSSGASDIQSFLEAWDETLHSRAVPGASAAGVRILTIHKSKGLAFHTVLLPFSHWKIENVQRDEILWCETEEAPFGELGALPIPLRSRDAKASVFASDCDEEHLERRVDALNTLYVAFTRAKANLYVWGKTKRLEKRKTISTAAELIDLSLAGEGDDTSPEFFLYEAGEPLVEAKKEEKKRNRLRLEHHAEDAVDVKVVTRDPMLYFRQSNMATDYLGQLKEEEGMAGDTPRLSQREMGKRMHEVLSRLSDASRLEEVIRQARSEGIIGQGEEWDDIAAHVAAGLRDPLVASWFKPDSTVYNECAIASTDLRTGLPQVLRPDRVVMDKDNITVVDYKFGHPSRIYHDQVQAYMQLMQQMYPQMNVRGYLWYVMKNKATPVLKG